jgi:DNA-binding transcriptional MerR regulator
MANPQLIPFSQTPAGGKSPEAFRTISEVAAELELPQHVLRFWETRFAAVRPLKRSGGRRYYRPEDVALLRRIRDLLREKGYTIKGVQKLLRHGGERPASDNVGANETTVEAEIRSESEFSEGPDGNAVTPIGHAHSADEAGTSMISPDLREELAAVLAELEELRLLVKTT